MKSALLTRRIRRVAARFDMLLMLAIAASYPLYIQFDALPRANEFGPPAPDRYPWAVTFLLVSYLGYRCKTVAACVGASALFSVSAVLAQTDAADLTGVAKSPVAVSVTAVVIVFMPHLVGRSSSVARRGSQDRRGSTR
jgi:hypothetical protein